MKKLFAIVLILVLALSFAACGGNSVTQATPTPEEQEQATPTPELEECYTPTPTVVATPEPTPEPLELVAEAKLNDLNSYKIVLVETENGKGQLKYIYTNIAPADELEQMGFEKSLSLVETIIYDVTIEKNENGYKVSGAASAVTATVVGQEAEKFLQMMLPNLDDELQKRAMQGEILTGDDLEKYLYEIDGSAEATFTPGQSVAVTLKRKFTQWGSQESVDHVIEIENNAFKTFNRYENGELVQDGLNAEE